jgi:hypothetical protein
MQSTAIFSLQFTTCTAFVLCATFQCKASFLALNSVVACYSDAARRGRIGTLETELPDSQPAATLTSYLTFHNNHSHLTFPHTQILKMESDVQENHAIEAWLGQLLPLPYRIASLIVLGTYLTFPPNPMP